MSKAARSPQFKSPCKSNGFTWPWTPLPSSDPHFCGSGVPERLSQVALTWGLSGHQGLLACRRLGLGQLPPGCLPHAAVGRGLVPRHQEAPRCGLAPHHRAASAPRWGPQERGRTLLWMACLPVTHHGFCLSYSLQGTRVVQASLTEVGRHKDVDTRRWSPLGHTEALDTTARAVPP